MPILRRPSMGTRRSVRGRTTASRASGRLHPLGTTPTYGINPPLTSPRRKKRLLTRI